MKKLATNVIEAAQPAPNAEKNNENYHYYAVQYEETWRKAYEAIQAAAARRLQRMSDYAARRHEEAALRSTDVNFRVEHVPGNDPNTPAVPIVSDRQRQQLKGMNLFNAERAHQIKAGVVVQRGIESALNDPAAGREGFANLGTKLLSVIGDAKLADNVLIAMATYFTGLELARLNDIFPEWIEILRKVKGPKDVLPFLRALEQYRIQSVVRGVIFGNRPLGPSADEISQAMNGHGMHSTDSDLGEEALAELKRIARRMDFSGQPMSAAQAAARGAAEDDEGGYSEGVGSDSDGDFYSPAAGVAGTDATPVAASSSAKPTKAERLRKFLQEMKTRLTPRKAAPPDDTSGIPEAPPLSGEIPQAPPLVLRAELEAARHIVRDAPPTMKKGEKPGPAQIDFGEVMRKARERISRVGAKSPEDIERLRKNLTSTPSRADEKKADEGEYTPFDDLSGPSPAAKAAALAAMRASARGDAGSDAEDAPEAAPAGDAVSAEPGAPGSDELDSGDVKEDENYVIRTDASGKRQIFVKIAATNQTDGRVTADGIYPPISAESSSALADVENISITGALSFRKGFLQVADGNKIIPRRYNGKKMLYLDIEVDELRNYALSGSRTAKQPTTSRLRQALAAIIDRSATEVPPSNAKSLPKTIGEYFTENIGQYANRIDTPHSYIIIFKRPVPSGAVGFGFPRNANGRKLKDLSRAMMEAGNDSSIVRNQALSLRALREKARAGKK